LISGIVLAAGTSSRLGRAKQLLDLDGKPVLQHVVDALDESFLDEIVVVLGHEAEVIGRALRVPASARIVVNPHYAAGQSTSLRCGLESLGVEVEAAVIVLGDQPGVTAGMIDRVIEEWKASGAPVVRAYFGSTPGHPVLVGRAAWGSFTSASGDEGARTVMSSVRGEVRKVVLGDEPLVDVDTWEGYERLIHGE
jgi:molybdenum cofactor cytidylyltransferase